jgi:methionyl-tRNA synthetase
MKQKFYITTAIDYPNGLPHIGTAFEKLGADVLARYRRFMGDDVFFLMGNDENTVKVVQKAKELGYEDIQVYVNHMAFEFKGVWTTLNISYDRFIQTSEPAHHAGVQHFLNQVHAAGFIYLKEYKAPYCQGCEEFKTKSNLVDGRCPNHPGVALEEVSQENYFFALSKFRDELLSLYRERKISIEPESRLNEIVNVVETDLQDISISRTNMEEWGIPIPWDQRHKVYVWFDALLNYLTGCGFADDDDYSPLRKTRHKNRKVEFGRFWPADVHVIGKDITRFHCALFPAMIMAYNKATENKIDLPKRIFAHGFIYEKSGEKIAKSGKFIDPIDLDLKYGTDAYRYYFLSKCPFDKDGEYSAEHFHEVYNELANSLGNLVNRVVTLCHKQFVPLDTVEKADSQLLDLSYDCVEYVEYAIIPAAKEDWGLRDHWITFNEVSAYRLATEEFRYRDALEIVWELVWRANKYVEDEKPWQYAKAGDVESSAKVLRNLIAALRLIAVLLKSYLPETAMKIYKLFKFPIDWEDANSIYLNALAFDNGLHLEGEIGLNEKPPVILFPRVEGL